MDSGSQSMAPRAIDTYGSLLHVQDFNAYHSPSIDMGVTTMGRSILYGSILYEPC